MSLFGVVAGKFLPFHVGHRWLIKFALANCDHLDVILVANPNDKFEPVTRRAAIYETFPNSNMTVYIVDDIMTDDNDPQSSIAWGRYTEMILGYRPNIVFASEHYGQTWADAMGAQFMMCDNPRINFPISGTICRENGYKASKFLPPATKRYVLPRVVVLGAESTGTTTLANALGEHYSTLVVPENGRLLSEELAIAHGPDKVDEMWDDKMFILNSRTQDAMEERYASQANGLLICDTDSLATSIWYKYYTEKKNIGQTVGVSGNLETLLLLEKAGLKQAKKHGFYIVTDDDIAFTQDVLETRTGEHLREWMTDLFLVTMAKFMGKEGGSWIYVSGSHEERLKYAVESMNSKVLRI